MGVSEKTLIHDKALMRGVEILDYIPQRPPVVMVDAFYGIDDDDVSHSGFTIPVDNIFCPDGVLDECALIENMAQSAALRVGFLCVSHGRTVPLGFIGAVDRCDFTRKALAGEELRTTVKVSAEIGNVTLAEVRITVDGEEICHCRLKIYLEQ